MILLYSEHQRRYIWNVIILVASTFLAIYIPLQLQFDSASSPLLDFIYWTCNMLFIIDIGVRYHRFTKDQTISKRPSFHFFGGWFIVDLLAAIPFGVLFGQGTFQLIRLIKLARGAQFIRSIQQAEVRLSILLSLVSFVFWAALLVHWLSCGWLSVFGMDPEASDTTNYISSLYWTITTLTAVGYGDIVPFTNPQRLYAILVQISGIAVFGYLIGEVVSIISKLDAAKVRYAEQVELLSTALKRRGLSKDLQRRILDYYTYLRDEDTAYDESTFLKTLPEGLRTDVALDLKKGFIESIPLFREADDKFIIEVALKLESLIATPGEYIFKAGDPGDALYFVIRGSLNVYDKSEDKVLTILKPGDFFGEIAIFKRIPRSATVKAKDYCQLYKLKRKIFKTVMKEYPDLAKQIEEKARTREERYFEE